VLDKLVIPSPKRRPSRDAFQRLYPYYAGFPESFVQAILSSSLMARDSLIYDPWNGSGTTTSVASRMGFPAVGFDLNPAMVIVAKARLLPSSEASSLAPLARAVVRRARARKIRLSADDPLLIWFKPKTASAVRSIERSCNEILIRASGGWKLEDMSSIAATLYTALFSISRRMATAFRTANPTWMRFPKNTAERAEFGTEDIESRFSVAVAAISNLAATRDAEPFQRVACQVSMADATTVVPTQIVDFVLTSPPYCTRIDYTAGTRVELALIAPLINIDADELRRRMIGTTMVPAGPIELRPEWGTKCTQFLQAVHNHPAKASKGYYYLTHLDYFDKMFRSISNLSSALRSNGKAILIVQDSYYKELHNDLPAVVREMAAAHHLQFEGRANFASVTCMSRINSRAIAHSTRTGSTESVLCFVKQ
jgi:hypothetical protein